MLLLLTACLSGCGKGGEEAELSAEENIVSEEEGFLSEQGIQGSMVLEDQKAIYFCSSSQIRRFDKEEKKSGILWESGDISDYAYRYAEGNGLLLQDTIFFMERRRKEIDRENEIINDLLTLVKMDKTAQDVNIRQTNVNDLLELILKRLRPIAEKKNVEMVLESFRPVVAEIDEVKMTLAISNLVENAIKYNMENGWVHVSLNADHRFFYVKVADSGIGIPKEDQEHVFERFFRVDKSHSKEVGGTGLGLAIARNAVLMHRGSIKVYSEANEGTTFTVRVPLLYQTGAE